MSTFSFESINKFASMDPNNIGRMLKLEKIRQFMELKHENPSFTQEQLCGMMNISSSAMKRIRNDVGCSSIYKYNVPLKKYTKKIPTEEEIIIKQQNIKKCSHCNKECKSSQGLLTHLKSCIKNKNRELSIIIENKHTELNEKTLKRKRKTDILAHSSENKMPEETSEDLINEMRNIAGAS